MLVSFLMTNHLVVSQSVISPLATDLPTYFIRTLNGKEFIGKIMEENDSTLTVQISSNGGESFVLIPKKETKEKKIVQPGDLVNGQYWGTIPNISYTFSPSGYPLRKGQWNFQNIWIIYNQLNYGVTNHLQLGVGGLVPNGMLWANARITLPIIPNKLSLGGAINYSLVSNASFWVYEPRYLIAYGFTTFGSPHANFSIGYGRVYNKENNSLSLVILSGAVRASKTVLMVTENYIDERVNEQTHLIGIRTGRRTFTSTVGVAFTKVNSFRALPWIGFGIRFGKK